jgi:hypothetical protein
MDIYLAALVHASTTMPTHPAWKQDEDAYFAAATLPDVAPDIVPHGFLVRLRRASLAIAERAGRRHITHGA